VTRGGGDGAPGRNSLNGRVLEATAALELVPGDVVMIETPGGGGFGSTAGE
jgi:N-methylhydantoinase B/oxoprolinase/acetone carboxylase alpha subunit